MYSLLITDVTFYDKVSLPLGRGGELAHLTYSVWKSVYCPVFINLNAGIVNH